MNGIHLAGVPMTELRSGDRIYMANQYMTVLRVYKPAQAFAAINDDGSELAKFLQQTSQVEIVARNQTIRKEFYR